MSEQQPTEVGKKTGMAGFQAECDPGMTLRDYFAAKAMQAELGIAFDLRSSLIADAMVEARKK